MDILGKIMGISAVLLTLTFAICGFIGDMLHSQILTDISLASLFALLILWAIFMIAWLFDM